jgi:hypothetical protein
MITSLSDACTLWSARLHVRGILLILEQFWVIGVSATPVSTAKINPGEGLIALAAMVGFFTCIYRETLSQLMAIHDHLGANVIWSIEISQSKDHC